MSDDIAADLRDDPLAVFVRWFETLPRSHDDDHPNCGECRQCVTATLGIIDLLLSERPAPGPRRAP